MSEALTVFITGSNTGLGYEIVKAMMQSTRPYRILMGGRTVSKIQTAIQELKEAVPATATTLDPIQIDIADDASISASFEEVSKSVDHLDILINNAGVSCDDGIARGEMSTRQGWNACWDVNTVGTYIVTTTFMPLLFASQVRRLLFIASGTSSLAEMASDELAINKSPEAGWPKTSVRGVPAYRSSKAGMNMMFLEWRRVLKNDNFKVFAVSPGYLATGLGANDKDYARRMGALEPHVGGQFVKDVIEGQRDHDAGKIIRRSMVQPF